MCNMSEDAQPTNPSGRKDFSSSSLRHGTSSGDKDEPQHKRPRLLVAPLGAQLQVEQLQLQVQQKTLQMNDLEVHNGRLARSNRMLREEIRELEAVVKAAAEDGKKILQLEKAAKEDGKKIRQLEQAMAAAATTVRKLERAAMKAPSPPPPPPSVKAAITLASADQHIQAVIQNTRQKLLGQPNPSTSTDAREDRDNTQLDILFALEEAVAQQSSRRDAAVAAASDDDLRKLVSDISGYEVCHKLPEEVRDLMRKEGVVDAKGEATCPNPTAPSMCTNKKRIHANTFLAKLFQLFEGAGLKSSDLVEFDQAKARTRLQPHQIIVNAAKSPPEAHLPTQLFKTSVEKMHHVDRRLWLERLSNDCVWCCIDGKWRPFVVLVTMLAQDEEGCANPRRFYARGQYGNGGAAGQVNRTGNNSKFNKDPAVLLHHRDAGGVKLIRRRDGMAQSYNLYAADRIRVTVSEFMAAWNRGYRPVGLALGDWTNHFINQQVNKNAYLPMHLNWTQAGFVYTHYIVVSPLGVLELARDAPTKSEMLIGGMRECSAGTHQAMLLGFAHVKQQVDCVDIRALAPANLPPRNASQIVNEPEWSVVFEGTTTMIMSYRLEVSNFANFNWLVYNW